MNISLRNKLLAGMAIIVLALGAASGVYQPPSSTANVLWSGDAETGDLSQWDVRAPGQISVVTSPVGQGSYAYKYVLPSDYVSQGGKEAVWLSSKGKHPLELNGEEKYYGWQVFIPVDFPTNSLWSLVMQFKGDGTGSPPLALGYKNNAWSINSNPVAGTGNNVQLVNFPATKGRWERFVYHVKWSSDPSVGFIEAWYNGNLILPKKFVSNIHLSNGQPVANYINVGMYRDPGISDTVVFYQDGFTVGTTYESVAGGSPPVTSIPPTSTLPASTFTKTPTATRTALPPTATFTAVSVTPSIIPPSITASSTASQIPTSTFTPIPSGTPTIVVLPTLTPQCFNLEPSGKICYFP